MKSVVEMIPCQLENRISKFLYFLVFTPSCYIFTSFFTSFCVLYVLPSFLENALHCLSFFVKRWYFKIYRL